MYDLTHESDLPKDFDGPFNLVWAYAIKPDTTKGLEEMYRPRCCVGKALRGAHDSTDDPVLKFAGQVDITFCKTMIACATSRGFHDFEFDIRQFHQTTPIPAHAKPIICTQPIGHAVEGPNGEPKEQMYWRLLV